MKFYVAAIFHFRVISEFPIGKGASRKVPPRKPQGREPHRESLSSDIHGQMMEESAMDMTAVCSPSNITKPDLNNPGEKHELIMQEKYELKNKVELLERVNKELENEIINLNLKYGCKSELDLSISLDSISSKALFQENHELKKKIEILEQLNSELESDMNYVTQKQAKETSKLLSIQEELDNANSRIKHLETVVEEERLQSQRLIKESEETQVAKSKPTTVIVPDLEQLNILTQEIEKLEIQREDDQNVVKELIEEKGVLTQKLSIIGGEKQALQGELSEIKEHLDQKTIDVRNLNVALEGLREEKLMMQGEIQLLKASDTNAARGNSLFAEVEDNRQKIAAQREVLKIKYMNLKKMFSQKQAENNKLKLEIVKIRREEKEDEKVVHHDYTILIETYKQRVWELEERVKELEKKANQPPVVMSESDNSQWMWVHSMVENARKETRSLQEELDRRGVNYVTQGHQLLDSQKENRKLKSTVAKLQSDIDELRLQVETVKSVQENAQEQDGISPPATDVAIEYQKQKVVRFKEALKEKKYYTKHNSSSSDPDTSLSEQNKSLKEANNTSLVVVKEENKENIGCE